MIPIEPWPVDVAEARQVQERLAREVKLVPLVREPVTVAGVDASTSGDLIVAAAPLFDFRTLAPLEDAHAVGRITFPYVPGYLSFREAPAILEAVAALSRPPGIIIADGQGIAHPRRMGIASFLGVLLGIPAIGCAKSRLIGEYEEPGPERGSWSPLVHCNETVGAVVRTRKGVRPVFVSPGHLVTLDESIAIVLRLATRYRLPEPQRAADALSRRIRREGGGGLPART